MGEDAAIWSSGAAVVQRLRDAGHQAWLVGGCVRDRLLGRRLKDADVATSAEPDEVERIFPRTVAVGKAFGVVRVLPDGRTVGRSDGRMFEVEVATLRADDRYVDGRRPVAVRRGTLQEDAERRDLTVNALYADPAGAITDPVGGLADLHARRLRGIGDPAARIVEDRLRVLRVLRFAAVLGFAVEPATWAAVCGSDLAGVSRERILDELGRALDAGAGGAFRRGCAAAGQLPAITPGLTAAGAEVLDRLGPVPRQAALAAWLAPLGADAARAWLEVQPVPAAWRRDLPWLIVTAGRLGDLPVAARRRALRDRRAEWLVPLACAIDHCRAKDYNEWLAAEQTAGPCPLTAADLLAAGLPPGPALGAALTRLEDAWLEGRATDRAGLLDLLHA